MYNEGKRCYYFQRRTSQRGGDTVAVYAGEQWTRLILPGEAACKGFREEASQKIGIEKWRENFDERGGVKGPWRALEEDALPRCSRSSPGARPLPPHRQGIVSSLRLRAVPTRRKERSPVWAGSQEAGQCAFQSCTGHALAPTSRAC